MTYTYNISTYTHIYIYIYIHTHRRKDSPGDLAHGRSAGTRTWPSGGTSPRAKC